MTFFPKRHPFNPAIDREPEPWVFRVLVSPVISPKWWDNYIWVASGRGWTSPKYDTDIREILASNSIKDMK